MESERGSIPRFDAFSSREPKATSFKNALAVTAVHHKASYERLLACLPNSVSSRNIHRRGSLPPRRNQETDMTRFKMIGAAALAVALAAASPALARGGHGCGGFGGGGHFGGGAHFAGGGFRGGGFHGGGFNGFGRGIGAGLAAGAVIGGLGYYGGYGYDPYYGDSYAYDYDNGYAPAPYYGNSDFACQPGTWFRGQDGRRYLCQ
jgi:hypothetical protein